MEHEHTQHIAAAPDRVFAVLRDVDRLPEFVPQMTGARAGDGDNVLVDARYEGRTQHGEGWFGPTLNSGASNGDLDRPDIAGGCKLIRMVTGRA
jgi:hypothetical protein